jgi:acyl dehydratase
MATRELSGPPSMLGLYARTLAPLVPGASRLPFVGGRGSAGGRGVEKTDRGDDSDDARSAGELPDLELALAGVRVDPERLAAYTHVCALSLRDELPATYPHVLAFPLHLALMADTSFPFPAVGLVHLANRIVQHRPIELSEPLDLRVSTTPLQTHSRGRTFALVTQARVGEELVWEDHSTMLRRGRGSGDHGSETDDRDRSTDGRDGETGDRGKDKSDRHAREAPSELPPRSAVWRLPGDLGRRYAAVSGDRNPIHMHALSAKAFGFPRAIAHGMWTKARCLAALEQRLPDAFSVEVEFRRPILLPGKVAFGSVDEDAAIRFAVSDAERETRHLDGRIEPLGETPDTNEEG